MLSRRSLFTRLSAVALAPLVKLLPKAEDSAPTGYWAAMGRDRSGDWIATPSLPPDRVEALNRLINELCRKQVAQARARRCLES